MKEEEMNKITELFENILQHDKTMKEKVKGLRKNFPQVNYCVEKE